MQPQLCLIGHGDYSLKIRSKELTLPFGEINNAKKLHRILKEAKIPVTDILDMYELFEIEDDKDENAEILFEMKNANKALASAGISFITDYNNKLAQTFKKNLRNKINDPKNTVLFFLSWPGQTLSILSTGIQRDYPTIGKEDSYIKASDLLDAFPMKQFGQEVNLLTSESLLGAVNCKFYGIPLDKYLMIPNLAPPEAQILNRRSNQEKKIFRDSYIKKVAEDNKKQITLNDDTIVIGCPSRIVRFKNVELLIYAIAEVYKNHPNILLILKGNFDSEFDHFSMYSEKVHQVVKSAMDQPWFLWDKSLTAYPDVLKIYGSYDLCALLSGAELGSNTTVEVCSLGIPLLLLDATVNPYLYKGMAEFVRPEGICNSLRRYFQPSMIDLISKIEELVVDKERRSKLGQQSEKISYERFEFTQLIKRIQLMTGAAKSFFFHDKEEEKYRNLLREQFEADLKTFQQEIK